MPRPGQGPLSSNSGAEPGPLRKSVSTEQEQRHDPEQRRIEGSPNRDSRRAAPFICSIPGSVGTDVDLSLPTYSPPGEQTIPTELEQLLPPSPPERPIDADEIVLLNDELVPADRYTLDNETPRDLAPETVRREATPSLHQTRTVEDPVQGREISCPPSDLAQRLCDQLYEHRGCCRKCHEQRERDHETQHAEHPGLGEYMDRVQADGGYLDVLSVATVARREDNLAGQTSAQRKREIYTGIDSATPDARPVHLCLATDHATGCLPGVTFDIDSVVGFAHSLAVAKLGVRWNPTQMPVSDLRSSLHLDLLPVHYSGSDGRAHHLRRPVHKIPHYTFGRLVGFEDISLYFLFPRHFLEEQQSSRLRDDDFRIWMEQVLLPAIYQHYEGSLVQHYPSSFDHSRLNATARGVECARNFKILH
mgnify:CR=1 FL=1